MKFLIVISLVGCTIAGAAQTPDAVKKVRLGFVAAATATYLKTKTNSALEISNSGAGGGIRIGLLVSWRISSHFFTSTQLDMFGMNVNSSVKRTLPNGFTDYGTNIQQHDWLELPLDFNYVINPKNKVKAFVGLGASWMISMGTARENNSAILGLVGADFSLKSQILRVALTADKMLSPLIPPPGPHPLDTSNAPWPPTVPIRYEYWYSSLALSVKYLF